jgi:hypothetical protein
MLDKLSRSSNEIEARLRWCNALNQKFDLGCIVDQPLVFAKP